MSDSFNFISYGFLVYNASFRKCHITIETFFNNILKDFYHNRSHNLHMYFFKALIPFNVKLWFLSLNHLKFRKHHKRVCSCWKINLIIKHRDNTGALSLFSCLMPVLHRCPPALLLHIYFHIQLHLPKYTSHLNIF